MIEMISRKDKNRFRALLFSVVLASLHTESLSKVLRSEQTQSDGSLAGVNPILEFQPTPDTNLQSVLIWYRSSNSTELRKWSSKIDQFLNDYANPQNVENIDEDCSFDHPASDGKYCLFDAQTLGNCAPNRTSFGFPQRTPCVFLTLNKITNWMPEVFNETDENQITNTEHRASYQRMPDDLKNAIAAAKNPRERNMIWVSCEGKNPVDAENIGPVHYSPSGFPAYFFPFNNVKGYQSPIVAVQFKKPMLNVVITIECKAWAKNIRNDQVEHAGSVLFELLID